jgi:predicted hotdog family 3-hydroxylacyl-ACP dehydratase
VTEAELLKQLNQLSGLPAAEFVLHREPMLLLDRLVFAKPDVAVCEWIVREGNEFLTPGIGVPVYTGVEYMAQCIAVHAGALERIRGLSPLRGLLLGTRHYLARVQYFELGVAYRVECQELAQTEDGLGSYACRILLNDQIIAEARLAVLQDQRENKQNG